MSRIVYADHAATTALSDTALKAMLPYFNQSYGNPSSLYSFAQQAKSDLEAARAQVAACLNAQPEEIYFTSCGSESDNWALRGVAEQKKDKGRHIITSAIEHHAILHTARYLEKQGFEVTYLPVDGQGRVDPAAVKAALRPDTILISIMTANNEIGTIEPIAEIGAIAPGSGRTLPHRCGTGCGPYPGGCSGMEGGSAVSVRAQVPGPPGDGGALCPQGGAPAAADVRRRSGERPPGGHRECGRGCGPGRRAAGGDGWSGRESARLSALRDKLAAGLGRIPYSRLTGDPVNRLPGTASFVFEGVEGEALLLLLDARGICASSGSACSSASLDPSHVLLAIGLPHAIAHGSLRLTLGAENTEEDVAYLLQEVPRWSSICGEVPCVGQSGREAHLGTVMP